MMYSEFIEHSNFTEHYISFTEYTTYIEPIYMVADQIPTKQEFITLLEDTFKSLVIQSQIFQECKDTFESLAFPVDIEAELDNVKGCKMCDLEDTIDVQKYYTK